MHVCMYIYIYIYIHMYLYIYICMYIFHVHICMYIYPIFVNEIPAGARPSDDPDLARFPGPIEIPQTLAR